MTDTDQTPAPAPALSPMASIDRFIEDRDHDRDLSHWLPVVVAELNAVVDPLTQPPCSCHGIRHAVTEEDKARVKALEQEAIAGKQDDLALYYGARLSPCCTVTPTPEMVAVRAAADLRNGGPR